MITLLIRSRLVLFSLGHIRGSNTLTKDQAQNEIFIVPIFFYLRQRNRTGNSFRFHINTIALNMKLYSILLGISLFPFAAWDKKMITLGNW
ncbi:hypothetical protein BAY06_15495 [Elizabethkingia anophelis]|nr:hypothetical protein [Elizabethkingia anophelis]OPC47514.1 hypothetical protein BAY06_15495 [Elizabethkingia anophelis]